MLQNLSWNHFIIYSSKLILVFALAAPVVCAAQNLTIYDDSLENGWENYGWATLDYANTSPVHSGSDSISVTIAGAYAGIQIWHPDMDSTPYASISFWLNGGASGGQQLQMYGLEDLGGTNNFAMGARYQLSTPVANAWQQYTVPLSALGVANVANFTGFVIQDSASSSEPTFYLDDIQLISGDGPALTHLTINAGQPVRTADARWFGINAAQWDGAFDTPQTVTELASMGTRAVRIPGGSRSDDYHWVSNKSVTDNVTWATSLANFIHVMTNANVQGMITVNYGTGTSNEAAAWVAYCNASTTNTLSLGTDSYGVNWQTAGYWAALRAAAPLGSDDGKNFLRLSRTAPAGFKYWEVGNEEYGASWEVDSNSLPHDPYTYGVRAAGYITLMRAVDPTVKTGVVATPGEDSYANGYSSHPAFNAREGTYHNGWTAVMLATLKSLGVTPDFIIHHRYAQNPGGESDAGLLASSTGWASDAANLRQMITDYFGSGGTNIEMLCTENNSVSSNPGKQSVSLVNGLFMADSLAQLMQTEFNGLFWWNLRNGSDSYGGNNSSSLYGWRQYGDYGVLEGTDYYPPYYTARLMQDFVQAGDTVISAASDYSLLSTYAVRRQNGTLTILTINKDPVNTLTGQVAVASFSPVPGGTIYSYGIPQDTAAQTGTGSPDVAQSTFSFTGTRFNYAFPPYSATVMVLSPAAVPPQLNHWSVLANGSFTFAFTNFTGLNFTVLGTTNLALPINSWSNLGTAVESPAGSGQFQFTDSQAANNIQRFYRVRTP